VDRIAFPVADPRGPVSDSLRRLIDGARTVGASRVTTRGLLELAYDVCSQSASITDVQAVRTCPLSDGFPVRERAASTGGSPARTGTTWCATTPRGSTLRSTGAAAGSLPRPASGPLRPVALSRPAACRATPAVVLGARRTDQARAPRRLHRVGHDPWLQRSCHEHRRRPPAVQPPGPASHISTVPLQQQRPPPTGPTLPSRRRCCP
jgi:hypothetical protein